MSAVPNQPAQASHTDKLTDLRLQLHRNGYVPVPVSSPKAEWAGKSAGKRPGLGDGLDYTSECRERRRDQSHGRNRTLTARTPAS